MKVDKVILYDLEMVLKSPFRTSFGESSTRKILLVSIHSGDFTGWGECVAEEGPWYSAETKETAKHIISSFIHPLIKDQEISHPSDFPNLVKSIRGNQMAKACVEDALWDLYGKFLNEPLKVLIKGEKQKIPSGISLGIQQKFEILIEKISMAIEKGYKRVKIKIEPGWDVDVIRKIRDVYPDLDLMVDANSAYRLKDLDIFVSLDRFNLMMIEQPLQYFDLVNHAKLQKEISTPICLDESIKSLDDVKAALDIESGRIINVKPARVGGITETLKIHELALETHTPLWCGGMLETGIGRAKNVAIASLPSFTLPNDISETDRYFTQYLINPIFNLNPDGTLTVPDTQSGIGVRVNENLIKKLSEKVKEL